MAESCARAPYLSAKYNQSMENTRFGGDVDRQVSTLLKGNLDDLPEDQPIHPETQIILNWLAENYPASDWEYHVQEKVTLLDPMSSADPPDELTNGTPDLICVHRTEPIFVDIDWKSIGQMWAAHLAPPDENLQQLSYVAGFWLASSRKFESARIVLACWDARGVKPLESQPILADQLGDIVRRIAAVPGIDLEEVQPEASVGDHCDHCYQRMHCDAHLLPAGALVKAGLTSGEAAVAGFEEASGQLDAESAVRALAWMEQAKRVLKSAQGMVDIVEANVNAYSVREGPIVAGEMAYGPCLSAGKRMGATVATLEKEGLQRLIRPGKPGVRYKWFRKSDL